MRVDRSAKTGRPVVHGKASSYEYHGCRCDECRAAQSEKIAAWRAANPVGRALAIAQRRAYSRAEARLRELHPKDFVRIYAEEREREGLPNGVAS